MSGLPWAWPATTQMLPGAVPNLYPNTKDKPSMDDHDPHIGRAVNMGIVKGYELAILFVFQTNGHSNKLAGRMMSDHFLFLSRNHITPSDRYFDQLMINWLEGWSRANNPAFHEKVFHASYGFKFRIRHMSNTQIIPDESSNLQ